MDENGKMRYVSFENLKPFSTVFLMRGMCFFSALRSRGLHILGKSWVLGALLGLIHLRKSSQRFGYPLMVDATDEMKI